MCLGALRAKPAEESEAGSFGMPSLGQAGCRTLARPDCRQELPAGSTSLRHASPVKPVTIDDPKLDRLRSSRQCNSRWSARPVVMPLWVQGDLGGRKLPPDNDPYTC
jgi:hypothetical protein